LDKKNFNSKCYSLSCSINMLKVKRLVNKGKIPRIKNQRKVLADFHVIDNNCNISKKG
jgi:hypothetical protein